jgi:hypothetical protein
VGLPALWAASDMGPGGESISAGVEYGHELGAHLGVVAEVVHHLESALVERDI